ncbi:MAG: protein translocase subunit SecF [Oligoflexia bacterium]|nr:protein translocase subunit SecF [Oligoflexia bacterium]
MKNTKSHSAQTEHQPTPKEELINFNFVKYIGIWGMISGGLTVASLILIFTKGFNYGIDFAGGTEVQVRYAQTIKPEEVRKFTEDQGFKNAVVQQFGSGDSNEYLIRLEAKPGSTEKETNENLQVSVNKIQNSIKAQWPTAEIRRIDTVGPQVGNQLKRNGVLAMFYSLLCILIYIGLRFDYKFAPGAVICLFHDSVVTLGILSLLGKEINVQILAAVLTIIGYSLNDTIVVFDRIRENLLRYKGKPIAEIINTSINETMGRTILTSLTVFLATLSLYLFAGGVIEEFAFAMLIGLVLGIYSSIYIASPLIILVDKLTKGTVTAPAQTRKPAKA